MIITETTIVGEHTHIHTNMGYKNTHISYHFQKINKYATKIQNEKKSSFSHTYILQKHSDIHFA